MNYDYEIQQIKRQMNSLAEAIYKIGGNVSVEVGKRENTTNQLDAITPFVETKTAYLGDTEVQFSDVKDGNLSVFVENENGEFPKYTVERNADIITVYFEPLEYITNITISIS